MSRAYFTVVDSDEDIKLCLTCPYPECTNCLDSDREPGKRPERLPRAKYYRKLAQREACRPLLLGGMSPYKVSNIVGCTNWLATQVRNQLVAEGLL